MLYPLPFEEGRPERGVPADISPDDLMAASVYAGLLLDERTRKASISVEVQARVVLLGGRVRSAEVREIAGRIAVASGARDVLNTISVVTRGREFRWPNLAVLFVVGAYTCLVAGILGVHAGWIALALLCALGASALENRRRAKARRR